MFSPRIGLAYRPLGNSKLILRGGYGLYYVSIPWVWGSFQMVRNAPFAAELNYTPTSASLTPSLTFADPFPAGVGSNSDASYPTPMLCRRTTGIRRLINGTSPWNPAYAQFVLAHQLPGSRVGARYAAIQPERSCPGASSGWGIVQPSAALSAFWPDYTLGEWRDSKQPATSDLGPSPLCVRAFVPGRV